ncbi:NUMOD3 domain-containing DNA-binding protein [Dysgonomonas sp. Marseille-P4361]|uniref:NUMOD3 domain-containing DNA-binding protein n=1 Tax=Dysgonomonas sp. Marseille-P4361 TaxID=2161820 RepID=UPI000D562660
MRTIRKLSNEHKQKISESLKGDRNPNFGKTLSSSHRKKISQSLLEYWAKIE